MVSRCDADRQLEEIHLEVYQAMAILALIKAAHEAGVIKQVDMRNGTLEGSLWAVMKCMDRINVIIEGQNAEVANG